MPDYFTDEFVPNIQTHNKLSYGQWKASNPGEAAKWEVFRDAVTAYKKGQTLAPPTMTTKYGKALVAAGKEHMSVVDLGSEPPYETPEPPPPPPNKTMEGPINITAGATISNRWFRTTTNTPAVSINTTAPVIIEDCLIESMATGALDHLLRASGAADVTIRRCTFNGPNVFPNGWGRSMWFSGGYAAAIIENNTVNRTGGIYLQQARTGATVRVRYNKAFNVQSDVSGGGGVRQFCQMNNNHNMVQCLIEWNQVINNPNQSRSEDIFSIFNTSNAILRNNYVQGGWAYPLTFTPSRGTGMLVSDVPNGHHNECYDNQIIGITNVALGITGGHDNTIRNNTVVSDGKAPDGTILTNANNGIVCYDYYNSGAAQFYNNRVYDNMIGNMGYRNGALVRVDEWCPGAANNVPADNDFYYNNHSTPITKADEDAEWPKWLAKVAAANITLGAP